MNYFELIEDKSALDLAWNIPEKKEGVVNIIGGNKTSFRTEIKVSEFLTSQFPVRELFTVLPDALKNQLPSLPNFKFLKSTDSGSFSDSEGFKEVFNAADFNLVIGDLSKNSITGRALVDALEASEKPTLISRDAIDLLADNNPEKVLLNQNTILFLSSIQLQKLLKAIYYPKMFLLSQSLNQAVEILHKFTLSYPVSLITLYNGQLLVAKDGIVRAVKLEKTKYTPITAFSGELAAAILAFNLYNPNNFIEATIAAML